MMLELTLRFHTIAYLCLCVFSPTHYALANDRSIESASWRFEFDNDLFFQKDNKISSGLSLQHHSAIATNWDTLQKVPDFVRRWGEAFPFMSAGGLSYRAGIALGQVIQTPDDLSRKDLIVDDVPYAGVLTVQATWYAYNDTEFRGIEITAGVLGSASLAQYSQKLIHSVFNSEEPEGWDNQLKTELLLNLNVMRKIKILQLTFDDQQSFDLVLDGHVALGNLFTKASTGLEMRFGNNIPKGFLYVTDPVGLSMHYLANMKPDNPNRHSLYGSLVLRASAFAHNVFLDGNLFRDSHSVDKKPWVGLAVIGFHYESAKWGIHFNLLSTTDNVDTHLAGREQLGTIHVEWRF
ncbi:MAG: hypothetical protein DRR06_08000 [Gammaproteobacteria bacterium]|nr:MAG: hypothetical protein DRR06_08000 [Gammaproteobacteria bacterium]